MSATQMVPAQPDARAVLLGVRLITLAEVLGLVPDSPVLTIDEASIRHVLEVFAGAGVTDSAAALGENPTPADLSEALGRALATIEETPLPSLEWWPMFHIFGEELDSLIAVSGSSLHSYMKGDEPTPDSVAARLHTVTLIVTDLAGSYNTFGIRRWFERKRAQLSDHAPAEFMKREWRPQDEDIYQIKALAASLTYPITT